jgi:HEAT repeat protein
VAAAQRLGALDEHADRVLELSRLGTLEVRSAALEVMVFGGDRRFQARLVEAFSDPVDEIRAVVLKTLANWKALETVGQSLKVAFEDPSPLVRLTAIRCLAPLARENVEFADKLIVRLHDPDLQVAKEAVTYLTFYTQPIGSTQTVASNALGTILNSSDPELRAGAGRSLACLGATAYFPELVRRIADPSEPTVSRQAIVAAIRSADMPLFAPALQSVLRDATIDTGLKTAIEIALDYWKRGVLR